MQVRINGRVFLTTGQQLSVSPNGIITCVREPQGPVYRAARERFMGVPQGDRVRLAKASK